VRWSSLHRVAMVVLADRAAQVSDLRRWIG
jgi:hypothetical protein